MDIQVRSYLMDNTFILELQNANNFGSTENMLKGNMINIEQGVNIYHLLMQTILMQIPGDVVELGCFEGITSILMQKTLNQFKAQKKLHVFDSFAGLPKKSKEDGEIIFSAGSLKVTKERLINNFKSYSLQLPIIHEGWFKDTLPHELPNKISFAHLDGDFYSSILESLIYIYPRLATNAVVVIDDYCHSEIHNVHNFLPGVKKACDEFFKDKKEQVNVLIAGCQSHGYFRKE